MTIALDVLNLRYALSRLEHHLLTKDTTQRNTYACVTLSSTLTHIIRWTMVLTLEKRIRKQNPATNNKQKINEDRRPCYDNNSKL